MFVFVVCVDSQRDILSIVECHTQPFLKLLHSQLLQCQTKQAHNYGRHGVIHLSGDQHNRYCQHKRSLW